MITFMRMGFQGQLANQLFQYATLYAIAKRNGYRFAVPRTNNTATTDRYKRYALPDGFPNLSAENCTYKWPVGPNFNEPDRTQWTFNPRLLDLPDGIDLTGFYQTEKYFHWCRQDILREFQLKKEYTDRASSFLASIPRPAVFVHVRRGDALTHGDLTQIGDDPSWYERAALQFQDAHLVILSDDMSWCREKISKNATFSGRVTESPFTDKFDDLALMTLSDGGIICNSSFSWWGAWLGREDRKIVCPKNWSQKNVRGYQVQPPDVVPDHWVKV